MTAQEYLFVWTQHGDLVSPISFKKIADFKLKHSTIAYLEAGLPKEAAPHLSFVDGSNDAFTGIAKLEDQYDLDLELQKYVVIGLDGSGNPIAINVQQDDIIEWLDHEDYFAPSYCNQSLECLLHFLIIYRDFVQDIIERIGPNAFIDGNFTDEQYAYLKQRMLAVDPDEVNEHGFWKIELKSLLGNREYYKADG